MPSANPTPRATTAMRKNHGGARMPKRHLGQPGSNRMADLPTNRRDQSGSKAMPAKAPGSNPARMPTARPSAPMPPRATMRAPMPSVMSRRAKSLLPPAPPNRQRPRPAPRTPPSGSCRQNVRGPRPDGLKNCNGRLGNRAAVLPWRATPAFRPCGRAGRGAARAGRPTDPDCAGRDGR